MAEDLIFDLEVDFSGKEEIDPDPDAWRRSLRPRFLPC